MEFAVLMGSRITLSPHPGYIRFGGTSIEIYRIRELMSTAFVINFDCSGWDWVPIPLAPSTLITKDRNDTRMGYFFLSHQLIHQGLFPKAFWIQGSPDHRFLKYH